MPLLRLITRLNVGGPARQALLLTKALAPDYDTTLVAGRPQASEGELGDAGVAVHHVPLVRPVSPATDLRATAQVRRLIGSCGSRLVHTHMAKAGAVGRMAAATVRPRPRTVHTFHGHVLDGYFTPQTQKAFVLTERVLAQATDALVAVSQEIRDELLDLGIGRPAKFHVIPLGFDLSPLLTLPLPPDLAGDAPCGPLRSEFGLDAQTPLIAVVGRLVAIKDHKTLFAAMVLLPGVHLAVVGDGELATTLRADVHRLGLDDRVHFTGWRMDMPAVLAEVDLVVLTSRNEGTPVALIEAAAAGRAVVATAVGGVPAVVTDAVTGRLVPAGEADAVASRVSELLADKSVRDAMGRAGRIHVATRFGEDRLVADVRALYDDLL